MGQEPQKEENGSKPEVSRFQKVLRAHEGERHIIVLQDFPDPDAISSALAHSLICEEHGIESDIIYSGRISHQQNIALVKLLQINLIRYDDSVDLSPYAGATYVDNQGTSSSEAGRAVQKENIPAVFVVDHHEPQKKLTPEFSDVRHIGATATIYAQYLESGLVALDAQQEGHVRVATALLHGILSDTQCYVRAGVEDFYAAAFLRRIADAELLEKIMNQARSKRAMEIIYHALGNRVSAESFTVSGIGYLRTEDRDCIPQAADFLVTEENIHTAIVYGIVRGESWEESLIGSMRTTKLTIDPDEFIKEVLGKDAEGNYFGGGKVSAGGFTIPIGFLAGNADAEFLELKWNTFDAQIKKKIFAKLGVEEDNDSGAS
jgi:nanoRNase/pAp phosphatase (c-di-AMP/oligoRNAs hydrolase)